MTITLVQELHPNATGGANTFTFNIGSVFTATNLITVVIDGGATSGTKDVVSVKGKSNAEVFTQRQFNNHPNSSGAGWIYDFLGAGGIGTSGGFTDIVVVTGGANYDAGSLSVHIYEWHDSTGGTWANDGAGANNSAGSGASFAMGSITPSQSGDVFVSGMSNNAAGSITGPTDSYTPTLDPAHFFGAAYKIATDSSAHAGTWTGSSTQWQTIHQAYKVNAAAGANGKVNVWTGSVWKSAVPKVWTGSVWKTAKANVWTGSAWKTVNA